LVEINLDNDSSLRLEKVLLTSLGRAGSSNLEKGGVGMFSGQSRRLWVLVGELVCFSKT